MCWDDRSTTYSWAEAQAAALWPPTSRSDIYSVLLVSTKTGRNTASRFSNPTSSRPSPKNFSLRKEYGTRVGECWEYPRPSTAGSTAERGSVKREGWDVELVREIYEWVESKIVFPSPLTAWQFASAGEIRPLNDFSLEHIQGTKVGAGGGIPLLIYWRLETLKTSPSFSMQPFKMSSSMIQSNEWCWDDRRKSNTDKAGYTHSDASRPLQMRWTCKRHYVKDHNIPKYHGIGGGSGNPIRAHGIRFIKSDGNPNKFYEIHLKDPKGDVILSAGALGSPQILMLSGIGPKEHLIQFNITPLVDAREVGQSMQDNPSISIPLDYSSHALHEMHPDPPQVAGISNGSFRLIFETAVRFNTSLVPVVAGKVAFPLSKRVTENPSAKFNYLAEEKDLDECVEMVRLIEKISGSKSILAFVGRSRQSRLSKDEKELRDLCKEKVSTAYHYHRGCLVGSVVDKDYGVLGVQGLRVVDFSTFPDTPGTNPMATVLMLGSSMLGDSHRTGYIKDIGYD
ncbi:hypothetical protein ACLOJK_017501 [Asimina triloba]